MSEYDELMSMLMSLPEGEDTELILEGETEHLQKVLAIITEAGLDIIKIEDITNEEE